MNPNPFYWGRLNPVQAASYGALSDVITKAAENGDADLLKNYVTGNGIVGTGAATDVSPLREQFLVGHLVTTLYSQDDARTMKLLPVMPVGSTIVEFSRFDMVGTAGDGFVAETGTDGAFGLSPGDDAFSRQTRVVRYMASERQVGIVARNVNNIEDPQAIAERAATLEIIRNANLAILFGDNGFNGLAFDGIWKQIYDHVVATGDPSILIDMRNNDLGIDAIATGSAQVRNNYGNPSLLIQSVESYEATQVALYPQERAPFGYTGSAGADVDTVKTGGGNIRRTYDAMLRPGRPLKPIGPTSMGAMPTAADTGALTFSATPWQTGAGNTVAAAAGTGPYYVNQTRSTDSAVVTKPAVPSAVGNNNAQNNLAAGTYYYAVTAVINGKESLPWVLGCAAAGVIDGTIAGITVTAGQVAQLKFTSAVLTGYSANVRTQVHLRVYRTAALASAPTQLSQFQFLMQTAFASGDTTALCFDNGMYIPGTTVNFMLTEKRDGRNAIVIGQLMEMMRRELPNLPMANQFCMLAFLTPIVFYGGFHLVYYNVRSRRPFTS